MSAVEIKHTPGPWHIEGKYAGDSGSLYLSTMHPMPVFELVPVVGTEDEHIANAQLIAAAPDLLEALKAINVDICMVSASSENMRLIRAAIAKAEGRSNA